MKAFFFFEMQVRDMRKKVKKENQNKLIFYVL